MEKKTKKPVVSIDRLDEKAVNELKDHVAALTKNGEEMGKVIADLKSQIGGYKASNQRYKNRIEELEKKLKAANDYANEGNELNEKRLTQLDEKQKKIEELYAQIDSLNIQLSDAKKVADGNMDMLKTYVTAPWWKRIFM